MNRQVAECDIHIETWRKKGTASLKPNTTYTLVIDYPLSRPAEFKIKSGKSGVDLSNLINKIVDRYYKIYKDEEKYGIWGHCLGDLRLEHIIVDHAKKTIELWVGS